MMHTNPLIKFQAGPLFGNNVKRWVGSKLGVFLCLFFLVNMPETSRAEEPKRECLGRQAFDVTDGFEWALAGADAKPVRLRANREFKFNIEGNKDFSIYGHEQWLIQVSGPVSRSEFSQIKHIIVEEEKAYLKASEEYYLVVLKNYKELTPKSQKMSRTQEFYEAAHALEEEKKEIALGLTFEHFLGIPDAYVLGTEERPHYVLLWRNERVYYFSVRKTAPKQAAALIKDLVSRFQPRGLFEVPEGNGFCFPYGFIRDDGTAPYSIKNSARYSQSPLTLFSYVFASHYRPMSNGYDTVSKDLAVKRGLRADKWTGIKEMIPIYRKFLYERASQERFKAWSRTDGKPQTCIGMNLTSLESARYEPLPNSGETLRTWNGLLLSRGKECPVLALQLFTRDDTTDIPPKELPSEATLLIVENFAKSLRPLGR